MRIVLVETAENVMSEPVEVDELPVGLPGAEIIYVTDGDTTYCYMPGSQPPVLL